MTRPTGAPPPLVRPQDATTDRTLGLAGQVGVVGLLVAGGIVGTASVSGLFWFVPFAGVGALLIVRRPRTSIGWILMGLGWASVIVTATLPGTPQQYANATVGPLAGALAVVQGGSGPAAFLLFAVLATVFPSGRLPTGPWGAIGRVALGIALSTVVAALFMPVITVNLAGYPASVPVRNPAALLPDLAVWRLITPDTTVFPVIAVFIAAAVSLVIRALRARGTERLQLRWFAASIAFVVAAVLSGFVIGSLVPGSSDSGVAWIPAIVAFPSVPVAVGIAVLRYRLYEIDRIVSRTLAYAVLSAVLAIVFVGVVLGLQALLATFTQRNTLAVAISTLVVAALFQPIRGRVQRAADRRFNRSRYDADRTVAAFADRLRDEVDLSALRGDLSAVAFETLHPARVDVWIRANGSGG